MQRTLSNTRQITEELVELLPTPIFFIKKDGQVLFKNNAFRILPQKHQAYIEQEVLSTGFFLGKKRSLHIIVDQAVWNVQKKRCVLADTKETFFCLIVEQKNETVEHAFHSILREGIVVHGPDQRIIYANKAAERIIHAPKLRGESSTSREWHIVDEDGNTMPGDTHPAVITAKTGKRVKGKIMGLMLGKTIKWIEVSSRRITWNQVKNCVFVSIIDITTQKKLEDAINKEHLQFEQAMEYSPIGMAIVSLDGAWVKVNKAMCQIVQYSKKALLRTTFQEITHPDDLEIDLLHVQELIAGKANQYTMKKRYIRKDKSIVFVQLDVSVVRDEADTPLYFISQVQDITFLEQQRLMQEKQLEKLQHMNRLMVGRELKMIELKKEIETLKGKL